MSHQTGYCCQPPFHAYWAGGEGGRRYARTNDKKGEVPLHENCSSDSGSRTVKNGCSQLTSRQDFSRILRSRHRRVYCMVLLRTAPCLQSPRCSSISNLSGAEESRSLDHQRSPQRVLRLAEYCAICGRTDVEVVDGVGGLGIE